MLHAVLITSVIFVPWLPPIQLIIFSLLAGRLFLINFVPLLLLLLLLSLTLFLWAGLSLAPIASIFFFIWGWEASWTAGFPEEETIHGVGDKTQKGQSGWGVHKQTVMWIEVKPGGRNKPIEIIPRQRWGHWWIQWCKTHFMSYLIISFDFIIY